MQLDSGAGTGCVPMTPAAADATTFVATTSCAVELDRPLRDRQLVHSRSGDAYDCALVLVRLHEEPLGVVRIVVRDGWLRALDVADAILSSLRSELAAHVSRNYCWKVPDRAQALVDGGQIVAARCGDCQRGGADRLPPVTVIVPTAGRPDDLRRCLARLAVLDYPQLEIVVVDNRPDIEATGQVVKHAASLDRRVRYIAEHRPGSSVARNRGVAETSTDIIAFTDDDVEVDELWLRWMIEPFLRDERVHVVTGLVLPASYDTPEQQQFEEYAGFGKGFRRRVYDMDEHRPRKQMLYPYWGAPFGSGNSMAFRRDALLAIGGFDPALGAGSPALAGGDIEAFTQILLHRGRLVYEPRAVVWHDHRRDEASLTRQLFNYAAGSTAILTKWLMRDPRTTLAVGRAIGSAAASAGRGKRGRMRHAPRELSRLNRQLALSSTQAGLGRQLRGFASGPLLYLKSRRWARRQDLASVLTEPRTDST